jgi:hypothetical protein
VSTHANPLVIRQATLHLYAVRDANTAISQALLGPASAHDWATANGELGDPHAPEKWGREGVLVLDYDRHVGLVDGESNLVERRYEFQMLRHVWPGWEVRWAPDGIWSILDYLGWDRGRVHTWETERELPIDAGSWADDWRGDQTWSTSLLSVRQGGRVQYWPSVVDLEEQLMSGPDPILAYAPTGGPVHQYEVTGGLHVDADARTLAYWSGSSSSADMEWITARGWPGFRTHRWYDAFEEHNRAIGHEAIVFEPNPPWLRTPGPHVTDPVPWNRLAAAHRSVLESWRGRLPPPVPVQPSPGHRSVDS